LNTGVDRFFRDNKEGERRRVCTVEEDSTDLGRSIL